MIMPNPEEAAFTAHLEKARAGEIVSQLQVAQSYALGIGVAPDQKLAADWFEKAADQGNSFAQNEMAGRYYSGVGREKNEALALILYRKAAEQNHSSALSTLGYLYEKGEIVPQDDTQAAYWYKLSLEHNEQIIRPLDHIEIFWERRAKAGVPANIVFRTKPEIALQQIQAALVAGVPSRPGGKLTSTTRPLASTSRKSSFELL